MMVVHETPESRPRASATDGNETTQLMYLA